MSSLTQYFHPVLAAGALGKGPAVVELGGSRYVLFRGKTGKAHALVDACPHRQTPLSQGTVRRDGRLACAYHGWHFDGEGRGCNPTQPGLTRCDARALNATERYGYIWIAGREGATPLPQVAWEREPIRGSYRYVFEVPLHVLLANISDVEHIEFLHARGMGILYRTTTPVQDLDARLYDDRSETTYSYYLPPPAFLARSLGPKGVHIAVRAVTRFDPLRIGYTAAFSYADKESSPFVVLHGISYLVPETAHRTSLYGFWFVKLSLPGRRLLTPIVARAWLKVAEMMTAQDQAFLPALTHTSLDTRGMRLDKLDKPIAHNLRLLRRSPYMAALPSDGAVRELEVASGET
jgi:phenylpropionate dioxygenase-like ring-hydroxylating dioxygenase large terminal subunit